LFFIIFFQFKMADSIQAEIIWPIDRPQRITSTFGEFREVRFHHGLDVSCGGRKGFKIFTADDGYVSSVMYQKWGIGYAVFVRHKSGLITFYGHMDRFSSIILKNSKVREYYNHIINRKDFRIDFTNPEITLKKGTLIGYSGDSGRGIEHFHFELRDRDNNPINPLRFGFRVRDKTAPVIEELYLVPLDGYSHVDGFSTESVYGIVPQDRKKSTYMLDVDYLPTIAGRIGVKVKVYDRVGYRNKVAVYGVESYINDKRRFRIVFDKIVRKFSHKMGLYYDYDNSNYNHFTYFLYSRLTQKDIIKTDESGEIIVLKIVCYDANYNKSVLKVRLKTGKVLDAPDYQYRPNLIPGRSLEMISVDDIFRIEFSEDSALYKEMLVVDIDNPFWSTIKGLSVKSRVYSVKPTNLCIDKPAFISVRYSDSDYQKVGIYMMNGDNNFFSFLSNDYDEGKKAFVAETWRVGDFFLIRDDSPPEIWYRKGRRLRRRSSIKLYVRDIGTGIDLSKVYLKVDRKVVFWDYDPDKHYIEILPHNSIWERGKHSIVIQIRDGAGNKSDKKIYHYYI
jgi:hypothetical protein